LRLSPEEPLVQNNVGTTYYEMHDVAPGLPYHRVIAAGGQVGGYGRDPNLKRALLIAEGHVIRRRRLLAFEKVRWQATGYRTNPKSPSRRTVRDATVRRRAPSGR